MAGITASVRAQDFVGEIMYVKRLDPHVNPTPVSAAEDAKSVSEAMDPPPPPESKGFYETELKLRSLSTTRPPAS